MKIISTKLVAISLGICETRVCKLLREGRIKGAYKQGRIWRIPLYKGVVKITDKRHGPLGSWHGQQKKKTVVHVNQHVIKHNQEINDRLPVFSVKQGNKIEYTNQIEFLERSALIYHPEKPLKCKATATLVTYGHVKYISECSSSDVSLKALQVRKEALRKSEVRSC